MTAVGESFVAEASGKCDCCATPYEAGSRLHLEFDRFRVLDVHPVPKLPPVNRKWRLAS